jgi:hypothetical protein
VLCPVPLWPESLLVTSARFVIHHDNLLAATIRFVIN